MPGCPGLPAPVRAQFEYYRARADAALLEKREVSADDALRYLDQMLERAGELIFVAAVAEHWQAGAVRAKLEALLRFIIAELIGQHRRHLVGVPRPLASDTNDLMESFLLRIRTANR